MKRDTTDLVDLFSSFLSPLEVVFILHSKHLLKFIIWSQVFTLNSQVNAHDQANLRSCSTVPPYDLIASIDLFLEP